MRRFTFGIWCSLLLGGGACNPLQETATYKLSWKLVEGGTCAPTALGASCTNDEVQCSSWSAAKVVFGAKGVDGTANNFEFPCNDRGGFSAPLPLGQYILSSRLLDSSGAEIPVMNFDSSYDLDGQLTIAGEYKSVVLHFFKP